MIVICDVKVVLKTPRYIFLLFKMSYKLRILDNPLSRDGLWKLTLILWEKNKKKKITGFVTKTNNFH